MLKILRKPEVVTVTGLSLSSLYLLEKKGEFPARVRMSDRACGWRSDEVEAWIRARPRAADTQINAAKVPETCGAETKGESS